ncbi:MAG: acetate--CoA ligase family protein [Candidatus Zixiibacteriota bacterium]
MHTPEGLDKIFRPRSVAVIGATARAGTIGQVITHNLVAHGFTGPVFPVNPSAGVIHSIKCYPSILDVPDPVDMAVIIVRKDLVLSTVEDCGRKGVGGVVVVTAGYREVGEEGARDERELWDRAQHYGMRMVGPNCFGVFNTDPAVSLNATFSRTHPLAGGVAFMTQSGSLGEAVLNHARRLGIGFSMFASVGNKADISGTTMLNYWKDDPATRIILLYLESFGDTAAFAQVAREVSRTKPIIAVKAGRTGAGARATMSHTGALSGGDVGVDALFDHCGILRVDTMEEMFDLVGALNVQPLPRGKRVAILTNAGGPAILATDAAAALGLDVVRLAPQTVATLKAHLPPAAATGNPVDMIASATSDQYRMALRTLFADPNVDAVLCIFIPPIMIDEHSVAEAIIDAHHGIDKPMVACMMGAGDQFAAVRSLKDAGIPVYTFPEEMAAVCAGMDACRDLRERPAIIAPPTPPEVDHAARSLATWAREGQTQIPSGQALALLAQCGIPIARPLPTRDQAEALEVARTVGYPIALKLEAGELLHKTEIGAVITDVRDEQELARHYRTLQQRAGEHHLTDAHVVVQPMVTGGVELVLGIVRDPTFGPMVMCGLGGILVEAARDVVFRLPPITRDVAREMLGRLHGKKLLEGFRGAPPVDLEPVVSTLVTLSHLASAVPGLEELDINPFVARPAGVPSLAVDARIVLTTSG